MVNKHEEDIFVESNSSSMLRRVCQICDALVQPGNGDFAYAPYYHFCYECTNKYPPALRKALIDSFFYAACIQGLGIVEFETVHINGDWITFIPHNREMGFENLPYPFPRSLDVPLANILWIADAPNGS